MRCTRAGFKTPRVVLWAGACRADHLGNSMQLVSAGSAGQHTFRRKQCSGWERMSAHTQGMSRDGDILRISRGMPHVSGALSMVRTLRQAAALHRIAISLQNEAKRKSALRVDNDGKTRVVSLP